MRDQDSLAKFAFPPGTDYPYPRDVVIGPDLTIAAIRSRFDAAELVPLVQRLLDEAEMHGSAVAP